MEGYRKFLEKNNIFIENMQISAWLFS
jgi:hypothetical protein